MLIGFKVMFILFAQLIHWKMIDIPEKPTSAEISTIELCFLGSITLNPREISIIPTAKALILFCGKKSNMFDNFDINIDFSIMSANIPIKLIYPHTLRQLPVAWITDLQIEFVMSGSLVIWLFLSSFFKKNKAQNAEHIV